MNRIEIYPNDVNDVFCSLEFVDMLHALALEKIIQARNEIESLRDSCEGSSSFTEAEENVKSWEEVLLAPTE